MSGGSSTSTAVLGPASTVHVTPSAGLEGRVTLSAGLDVHRAAGRLPGAGASAAGSSSDGAQGGAAASADGAGASAQPPKRKKPAAAEDDGRALVNAAVLVHFPAAVLKSLANSHGLCGLKGKTKLEYAERIAAIRLVTRADARAVAGNTALRCDGASSGVPRGGSARKKGGNTGYMREQVSTYLREGGSADLACPSCGHRLRQIQAFKIPSNCFGVTAVV